MRKVAKLLMVSILLVGSVFGCGKKKIDQLILEGQKDISETIELTSIDELQAKIESKDDFILYVYGAVCYACAAFKPFLDGFIADNDAVVYSIEGSKVAANPTVLSNIKYTPSLVFYREGKAIKKVDPDKDSTPFANKEKLTSYIKKYAYLPQIFEVSKTQFDTLISNEENFIIYISSASCGDCSHFHEKALYPYLKANTITKAMYYIDVDKFLSRSSGGEATAEWIEFKNTYGLSVTGSATYGYGTGYVPTVQEYTKGVLSGAYVYLNDVGYVNEKFVVTEGFYGTESGVVGKEFATYTEYQDGMLEFYKAKFESFMSE